MDVPMIAESILGCILLFLIIIRTSFGYSFFGRKKRAGYEMGVCKTIGSREVQEDTYAVVESEDAIMAVLADGMGKNFGGKIASQTAVEAFLDMFQDKNAFYNPHYYFRKAFHAANSNILNVLNGERGAASIGAAMIKNHKLYFAAVGNVKIGVFRKGELVPVTTGHTVGVLAKKRYMEGQISRQEAIALLDQHRLYNYVGQDGFRDIEFFDTPVTLYNGEYVVLISNGMYEGLSFKKIEDCLGAEGSCAQKALELVEQINRKIEEDMDNASIVILQVK